jgi:hypothetical protein
MVAEGRYLECGGVTLHEMDEHFDAGPIIAGAIFREDAWSSENRHQAAISGAMTALVHDCLPQWCRGNRKAVPQDLKKRRWSGPTHAPVTVGKDWPFERLRIASWLARRSPGLAFQHGDECFELFPWIRKSGPPTGEPPARSAHALAFDIADARVLSTRPGRYSRRIARFAKQVHWMFSKPVPPERLL